MDDWFSQHPDIAGHVFLALAAFCLFGMYWSHRRGWIGGFYGGMYYRASDPVGYRRRMIGAMVLILVFLFYAAFSYTLVSSGGAP